MCKHTHTHTHFQTKNWTIFSDDVKPTNRRKRDAIESRIKETKQSNKQTNQRQIFESERESKRLMREIIKTKSLRKSACIRVSSERVRCLIAAFVYFVGCHTCCTYRNKFRYGCVSMWICVRVYTFVCYTFHIDYSILFLYLIHIYREFLRGHLKRRKRMCAREQEIDANETKSVINTPKSVQVTSMTHIDSDENCSQTT